MNQNGGGSMPNWLDKLMGIPVEENPVDKAIVEKLPDGQNQHVDEVYKARWVWYHTILAAEIFITNILLIAILIVLAVK
jgi:hypothetical protein